MSESLVAAYGTPAIADQADGLQVYVLAARVKSDVDAYYEGITWWRPTNAPGITCSALLYPDTNLPPLASKDFDAAPLAPGTNTILFDTPVLVSANTFVRTGVLTRRYAVTTNAPWPYSNGSHLSAPDDNNGCLQLTTAGVYVWPAIASGNKSNFFVGPLISPVVATRARSIFVMGLRQLAPLARRVPLLLRGATIPVSSQQEVRYRFTSFRRKWGFTMFTDRIDSTSLARVQIGVTADSNGLPYNPTSATVQMAFLTSQLDKPNPGDWKTSSWDVTRIGSYVAQCNVGSGGAVELQPGNYYTWIKITDPVAGEIPIEQVAKLIVV